MKNHKYTIVIPTRNRAHTLRYTLASCLAVDYENFEVLISDDNSVDDTTTIVQSFNDKRLKYFHTGTSTGSMANNWEFALSKIEDTDYITVVGDDDAILPESLQMVNELINKYDVSAVTWRKIDYQWPDHLVESFRNLLTIPLDNSYFLASGPEKLKHAIDFRLGYDSLPCLYNSFVSFPTIKNIKQLSNGFYFHGTSPDVYSAFANACFVQKYIYSLRPFSINGASGKSNGNLQFNNMIEIKESQDVQTFYQEIRNKFNNKLCMCPSYTFAVADSMLSAKDTLDSYFPFKPSVKRILGRAIQEIQTFDKARYLECRTAIIETANKHNLAQYANSHLKKYEWQFKPTSIPRGLQRDKIVLDGSLFKILNVKQAAAFCSAIFKDTSPVHQEDPQSIPFYRRVLRKLASFLNRL